MALPHRFHLTTIALIALLGALLAGCATTPEPLATLPAAAYRDNIELSGRLSVSYDKDGKNEALSGKFDWRQSAARTDVSLASPLGQTIAAISVTPGQATLTQSGKPPRSAADIDTLSAQALGWSLPVSGLRDWLQGRASGADGSRYTATPQHNTVTTRDGWRLTYVSWQDGGQGRQQPKRIDLQRGATLDAGALEIRIVLDAPAP